MPKVTHKIIVDTLREWSVEEQIALVKDLVAMHNAEKPVPKSNRVERFQRALGIADTENAPDDATVECWRSERVEERCG